MLNRLPFLANLYWWRTWLRVYVSYTDWPVHSAHSVHNQFPSLYSFPTASYCFCWPYSIPTPEKEVRYLLFWVHWLPWCYAQWMSLYALDMTCNYIKNYCTKHEYSVMTSLLCLRAWLFMFCDMVTLTSFSVVGIYDDWIIQNRHQEKWRGWCHPKWIFAGID